MINVGKIIKGFCDGYFGKSHNTKIVECEGKDWVVARDLVLSIPTFATFSDEIEKDTKIEMWIDDHKN